MKRLLSFSSPKVSVYMIKSNCKVHLGWTLDRWGHPLTNWLSGSSTNANSWEPGKPPHLHQSQAGWVQGTVITSTSQTWTRIELHENRGLTVWEDWNKLQGTVLSAHVSTAGCWEGRPAPGPSWFIRHFSKLKGQLLTLSLQTSESATKSRRPQTPHSKQGGGGVRPEWSDL